jgi:hypothetical protein
MKTPNAVQARAGSPFCGVLEALGPPCLTANVRRNHEPMMHLTAQEMKLVGRLRKEERLWPRHRWWMLAVGVFIEVCYGYLLISVIQHIAQEQSVHGGLAQSGLLIDIIMLWPKSLLMLFVGAVLIGWTARHWSGNVSRMLLLRLLDAQQSGQSADADNADAPPNGGPVMPPGGSEVLEGPPSVS